MTVNPRKLRPYDQPPKRRRPLIPEAPDSAATGFLAAAAVWLAIATGIGFLAVGLRVLPLTLELRQPIGIFGVDALSVAVDAERAELAFVNAVVFGWLSNAGFAAAAFMGPRLVGRRLRAEKGANVGLALWNLGVLLAVAGIYLGQPGVFEGLAAPALAADAVMLIGLVAIAASFMGTVIGRHLRDQYVSLWFLAVGLAALVALQALNLAVEVVALRDVPAALAAAFVGRGIETLWLLGASLAALHYVVPRASGNPLYSGGLAALAWVTWLALAALAPIGELVDTSVPYWITTVGKIASVLLIAPAFLVATNLLLTLRGRWWLAFAPGSLAFALVGIGFLLGMVLIQGIGALRPVEGMVSRTAWDLGAFVYAALGMYTFALLALGEHAVPRLLRREWGGGVLSAVTLWAAFGGVTIAALSLMGAGLAEGSMRLEGRTPEEMSAVLAAYYLPAAAGLGLAALAGLVPLVSVFLAYTAARPASYALPRGGSPTTASAGH
ncbi:MAG TPA: cbb3-type cytochrome c oxidase subunit I [Candidatus Limnocylindria bacterium]|nr:cbb3-type cytochrome c oxidase subunit I [Candidatus Limnocylindria bacterium]